MAILAMLAVVGLAGCGASGETDGETAAGNAKVDEAESFVEEWKTPPTSFELPPLESAPPRGKKVALVFNNIPESENIVVGAQEAAQALGWTTIPIIYDPSKPTGLQDAFAQAVAENPDAVVTAANDVTQFPQVAQKFAAKDIPVVTSSTADEVEQPIIANVLDSNQVALAGRITANHVVAEEGDNASVVMINIPSFSILATFEEAFKEEYLGLCPECDYKSVAVQADDVGTTVPAQVVSAVQTDPGINFVVMGFGNVALGVSGALQTAGISDVKIVGESPAIGNINALIKGTEDMWVAFPQFGFGWKSIDALARHFNNESVDIATSAPTPFQILTQDNVPEPATMPEVPNYQAYFKKLWHVD